MNEIEELKHTGLSLSQISELTGYDFRPNLFGPGVALDAFELRDGSPAGYHFPDHR